jgi:hypothetical protein
MWYGYSTGLGPHHWHLILAMLGTPQGPNAASSSNAALSVDIRQSILEWVIPNAPQHDYVRIKGPAQPCPRGYTWICTVFSGVIPPIPQQGDVSDIYIDTRAKRIYIKLETEKWKPWVRVRCKNKRLEWTPDLRGP